MGSLVVVVVVATALLVAATSTSADALEDQRVCSSQLPASVHDYANVFATRDSGWGGGDLTATAKLPDGRILWVFGDTFYGQIASDGSQVNPVVRDNSAFLQTGSCFDRLGSADQQWIPSPWPGQILWPQSVLVEGPHVHVFLLRIRGGSAALDFEVLGGAVATFGADLRAPISVQLAPDVGGRGFGWGVHDSIDGYTYLYSHIDDVGTLVARTPVAAPVRDYSRWRYWNGSSWVPDKEHAQPISPWHLHIAQDSSGAVHAYQFDTIFDRVTRYSSGGSSIGPWTPDAQHDLDTDGSWHPGAEWAYLATAHPWVPLADGRLLVAHNLLAFDNGPVYADAQLYGARANAVPFPCRLSCTHEDSSTLIRTDPVRILDTRSGQGVGEPAPLTAMAPTTISLSDISPVSSTATAAVLNITAIGADSRGWLAAYQGSAEHPGTAALTYGAHEATGGLTIVPLGPDATITLLANRSVDLVVDLQGWFIPVPAANSGRFVGVSPGRLLDTRVDGRPLQPALTERIPIRGRAGVPGTGVSAVAVTLTTIDPVSPGFVTAWASDRVRPGTASLNTGSANRRSNLAIVPVGGDGAISVQANVGTHLVVDVVGWFTDAQAPVSTSGLYVPLPPRRLADTRTDPVTQIAPGTRAVPVAGRAGLPAGEIGAAVTTVTLTDTATPTFATAAPHGVRRPLAAALTLGDGVPVASATTLTRLGTGGMMNVHTPRAASVVVDTTGYFTATPS